MVGEGGGGDEEERGGVGALPANTLCRSTWSARVMDAAACAWPVER